MSFQAVWPEDPKECGRKLVVQDRGTSSLFAFTYYILLLASLYITANKIPSGERERERLFTTLPLANTSITYSKICLYAVVSCQKGQSPSKLATHCSKQHNNTVIIIKNKKVVQCVRAKSVGHNHIKSN